MALLIRVHILIILTIITRSVAVFPNPSEGMFRHYRDIYNTLACTCIVIRLLSRYIFPEPAITKAYVGDEVVLSWTLLQPVTVVSILRNDTNKAKILENFFWVGNMSTSKRKGILIRDRSKNSFGYKISNITGDDAGLYYINVDESRHLYPRILLIQGTCVYHTFFHLIYVYVCSSYIE